MKHTLAIPLAILVVLASVAVSIPAIASTQTTQSSPTSCQVNPKTLSRGTDTDAAKSWSKPHECNLVVNQTILLPNDSSGVLAGTPGGAGNGIVDYVVDPAGLGQYFLVKSLVPGGDYDLYFYDHSDQYITSAGNAGDEIGLVPPTTAYVTVVMFGSGQVAGIADPNGQFVYQEWSTLTS